jgi:hypothetical protein
LEHITIFAIPESSTTDATTSTGDVSTGGSSTTVGGGVPVGSTTEMVSSGFKTLVGKALLCIGLVALFV